MATSKRLILHNELSKWLQNVYYQPPANVVLKYPCAIYERTDVKVDHANNEWYKNYETYSVNVLFTSMRDEHLIDDILHNIKYSVFGNTLVKDGVYNTSLTIKIN